MSNVTVPVGAWVNVKTYNAKLPSPWVPRVMSAVSSKTLAPAIGQAQVVFSDPQGVYRKSIKQNDEVSIFYSSRLRPTLAAHGPTPSWKGLVNGVYNYPSIEYGRCTLLVCSSYWKLFDITSVALMRLLNGQLPRGSLTPEQIIQMAIDDVQANTGIVVPFTSLGGIPPITTPPWTIPDDFLDPSTQSWASYLLSSVVVTGDELFFNENGQLILQPPQFSRFPADYVIPDEEVFDLQAGTTDDGLVTNVAVTYSISPYLQNAGVAPQNALTDIGPLPENLQGNSRLGKRFLGVYVPWLSDLQSAGKYAASVRTLGIASAEQAEVTTHLNGDATLGQIVGIASQGERYYSTTIQHTFAVGRQAETHYSLRYGISLNKQWDFSALSSYGSINLPSMPTDTADPSSAPANLPVLAGDPAVAITNPTITQYDIQKYLTDHGSPFVDQSAFILIRAQQSGIDPSFALAVWTQETSVGTAGVGVSDKNVGGAVGKTAHALGVDSAAFAIYGSYHDSIDDWFTFTARMIQSTGSSTVGGIGPTYDTGGDVATWVQNVTSSMATIRQSAVVPFVQPGTGSGDGSKPSGWPTLNRYGILQVYGCTGFVLEGRSPWFKEDGCNHFHRGVDVGCPSGTYLYATIGGTLVGGTSTLDASTGYGFLIAILNGPYIVKYGHCQGFYPTVSNNQQVKAGDVIGISGGAPTDPNHGNSNAAHVHYEIDVGNLNNPTNPAAFMG